MASKPSSKIHTHIGHDRALCGVNPNRGQHQVVSNAQFAATPSAQRCGRCADLYMARGYRLPVVEAPEVAHA